MIKEVIEPSSASWGGEWGLRRVRLDRPATSSRSSLWPYSVGMLRLSRVVPPAQVEPTHYLPCVYLLTNSSQHQSEHNFIIYPLIILIIVLEDEVIEVSTIPGQAAKNNHFIPSSGTGPAHFGTSSYKMNFRNLEVD